MLITKYHKFYMASNTSYVQFKLSTVSLISFQMTLTKRIFWSAKTTAQLLEIWTRLTSQPDQKKNSQQQLERNWSGRWNSIRLRLRWQWQSNHSLSIFYEFSKTFIANNQHCHVTDVYWNLFVLPLAFVLSKLIKGRCRNEMSWSKKLAQIWPYNSAM